MGRVIVFPPTTEGYECVLAFDSDDMEFTRGFEAGRVYESLKDRKHSDIEFQVHTTNQEMMERIAKATGYIIDALETDEEWTWVTLRFVRQNKKVG